MEWKGDFLNFEFAGQNSSDFNIVRISDGDRFEETLHPEINDIAAEVPGMDGNYYFGSTFGRRNFSISFAFDSLTEEQFRNLRRWLGTKHMGKLIFSERPYKYYLAKIESPIELSYVCFDEYIKTPSNTTQPGIQWETVNGVRQRKQITPYEISDRRYRIYKGEGKVEFVCYFPYAKSEFKYLLSTDIDADWAVSSGMISEDEKASQNIDIYNNGVIKVYNPGDVETGFRLFIPATNNHVGAITLSYNDAALAIGEFDLKPYTTTNAPQYNHDGVLIDTNSGLVVGATVVGTQVTTTGILYNEYVQSGYFFKLQPNAVVEDLQISGGVSGTKLFYDYLYF